MKKRIIFPEFKLAFYISDKENFEPFTEIIFDNYQILMADDIAVSYFDGKATAIVTWTFTNVKQKSLFHNTPMMYTEIKPETF